MNQSILVILVFASVLIFWVTLCWVVEGWNTPYELEYRNIFPFCLPPSIKKDGSTIQWESRYGKICQKDSWVFEACILILGIYFMFPPLDFTLLPAIQLAVFFVGHVRRHWFSYKLHKEDMGGGVIINQATRRPQVFDNMPKWLKPFEKLLSFICGIRGPQ